jgi:nucleotide-binding universal stress UspA family protein
MALVEAKVEEKKSARSESQGSVTTALSVKNVLFATDFSAMSEAAFPYAAAICRHFGSTLHTAHVLSDTSILMMTGGVDYVSLSTIYEDAHTEAKEKLDQISAHLEGIAHRIHVRHGQVWENLAVLIDEEHIDLIVLGTHGRSGLGKLLLGSVAENILRHAPCPVLTVGPKVSGSAKLPVFGNRRRDLAPVELELKQILFATNFAENSACVAQEAISLAEEFGARLTMLHAIEDYTQLGSRPGPMEDGVRRLHDLIPRNATLQYSPETLLEFGSAWKSVLKASADREADLIVLGARSSENASTTHLPSTSQHVIAQAECPVLTIRC